MEITINSGELAIFDTINRKSSKTLKVKNGAWKVQLCYGQECEPIGALIYHDSIEPPLINSKAWDVGLLTRIDSGCCAIIDGEHSHLISTDNLLDEDFDDMQVGDGIIFRIRPLNPRVCTVSKDGVIVSIKFGAFKQNNGVMQTGDAIAYDSWNLPNYKNNDLERAVFAYMFEHKPQKDHATIIELGSGKIHTMVHINDFVKLTEDEC